MENGYFHHLQYLAVLNVFNNFKSLIKFFKCFYCKREITCCCEKAQLYGLISNGIGIHGAQAEYVRVPLASSSTLVIASPELTDNLALLLGDVLSTYSIRIGI